MLHFFRFFTVLFLCLVLLGCQKQQPQDPIRYNGTTMGTTWSVVLAAEAELQTDGLPQQLQRRLDQINRLMSTYEPNSEVSRFNEQQETGWFPISGETAEVVELALEISRMTGGAFDISVGPLVDLWGFGPIKRTGTIPGPEQIEQRKAWIGYNKLELRCFPPALKKRVGQLRIDLSAVAKGYAVDELAALLRQRGIKNYLVEVGGELQVSGQRGADAPWRIAVEKPLEGRREVEKVIPLTDTALATSGNYRNFYVEGGQRYAHTIDPVSGQPIRHKLASVTILDPRCARADALATALMVLGEEKGRVLVEENNIAAYFLIHEQEQLVDYASPEFQKSIGKESP